MIDLRTMTETDVIDAMILLDGLATPAGELVPGDHIVYRRQGVIHSTEVESVTPAGNFGPDGVTVATIAGDVWSCSPRNRGQYRLEEHEVTDDEQLQQWENEGGASVSIPSDFPSMTEWDRMVISLDCQSNQYDIRSQKVKVTR